MDDKGKVEILHETAVKDFLYLSAQRLKFIRFYTIIMGVFIPAISITMYRQHDLIPVLISILLEVCLIYITYTFQEIDLRSKELISFPQKALVAYEQDYLSSPECIKELCIFTNENGHRRSARLGDKLRHTFYLGYFVAISFSIISIFLLAQYINCS